MDSLFFKKILFILISLFISAGSVDNAFALRKASPIGADSRIKSVPYLEHEVFKFLGHYGYQSSIEFEAGEEQVKTVSVGDSTTWQIVPAGDRIFLKPVEQNATTNMTVITNKRIYHFELHAQNAKSINVKDMTFVMKFNYPGEGDGTLFNSMSDVPIPELTGDLSRYNFNYSISGPANMAPVRIFDDGVFTYFQFPPNTQVPAFFIVRSDNTEEIVNFRARGEYMVVERVAQRFTLRSGRDIVCVYNEKAISPQAVSQRGQ